MKESSGATIPKTFFDLGKDPAGVISRYLSDKDLVNLCLSSKECRAVFHHSLEKRFMNVFLKYVVQGCLDKVDEALNKNKKLALMIGDVTDLSDRYFQNITGFQYAVWCGDEEMWNIFLKFLSESTAYDQLMALINKRPDITKKYGEPLSFFDPLLTAYQCYMGNYAAWDAEQCIACWCKEVGGAQRNMPAWFICVFSEEGKDKAWPTKQMTRSFSRKSEPVRKWFELEYDGGKCGSTFVFYRGSRHTREGRWVDDGPLFSCRYDLENSATLKTACMQKLAVLREQLSKAKAENNNPEHSFVSYKK